jgi:hypothetical protein
MAATWILNPNGRWFKYSNAQNFRIITEEGCDKFIIYVTPSLDGFGLNNFLLGSFIVGDRCDKSLHDIATLYLSFMIDDIENTAYGVFNVKQVLFDSYEIEGFEIELEVDDE